MRHGWKEWWRSMQSRRKSLAIFAGALIALCVMGRSASAQIVTGTVTGTVKDVQGGLVPGATVILVSERQATKLGPVVSDVTGAYVFPNVPPGTYTVEVSLSGFKTGKHTTLEVGGGGRVVVPVMTLETGGVTEYVVVTSQAPQIQAASGERSGTVESQQLQALPIGGTGASATHTMMNFITLLPGISNAGGGAQQRRTGGGGQDNVMLDGLSALDTGNNGVMTGMDLPVDAVGEIRVLTSGYSAEYGRSSGLQVSAVTRSGTNRFSGTIYTYERTSDWAANSWQNSKNNDPKAVLKERDWGFTAGGPIGRPGGNNKLFFFFANEMRPREQGGTTRRFRVPTALERVGDFSETRDNNGALFNAIYDPLTGLAKSQCVQGGASTGCFRSGGVTGRIPISRLYGPGLAVLNQYPMPNVTQATGTSYNYERQDVQQETLQYHINTKVDYQMTQGLRLTWKVNSQNARILPAFGQMPGITDALQKFPLSFNTSWGANWSINSTTFLEATYGINQNRLGTPSVSPLSNRNNVVCPSNVAALAANCTAGAMPFLFADAGVMNTDFYEHGALQTIGVPFLEGNRLVMPPQFNYGTTRIAGAPPSINYPGFMNINRIQQANVSVTKVMGRHTAKAGLYFEHSFKAQNTGGNTSFQGVLNVGVDTANPLDSQFPFSNMALGAFSTYAQGSKFLEGNFFYNNLEWYLQDNWKVNRRLTLDYGLRVAHDGPYTDNFKQVANFFEDKWALSNAPFLYVPGCVTANPCTGNNRQAKDPRTGALLGVGSTSLIGSVIVGSGDFANGMRRAGDGIADAGYTYPKVAVAPRFGAAYDVSGDQTMVLRGSVGLYFDRPDGNVAFGTVANPPTATGLTQQWGLLADIANSKLSFGPVPNIVVNRYDSALPKDVQWNIGLQKQLPWASAIDVAYVGHHAFDTLAAQQNGSPVNINTIDLGTTLPGGPGIDPTATTANTAMNNNLLRPYRGYQNINIQWPMWERTFHSLQSSFNRRFRNGLQFGVSHTWTLSDKGNTGLVGPQLRINHNADGSWFVRPDQAVAEKLFEDQGTVKHIIKGNFVYDLPDVTKSGGLWRAIGAVANDWQIAGVIAIDSGEPYSLTYSYNSGSTGQALTGSPDYSGRIVLNDLGALGSGCSSNQYAQINNTMISATSGVSAVRSSALGGPQIGSVGLESGRNYLTGCKNRMVDLAIQRTIRLPGGRALELRLDLYNAFNQVIYSARQTNLQLNSTTDQTVRNSQFLATGAVDPTRLEPENAGFGAATNAQQPIRVQGQVRFRF